MTLPASGAGEGQAEAGGPIARLTDSRQLTLQVLLEVEAGQGANEALAAALGACTLSARDRALVTNLVDGTLRWRGRLDHVLAHFSKYPLADLPLPILTILRLGAYQLLFLDRVPAAAAVSQSVQLARRRGHAGTAGLVNALLRRLATAASQVPFPDPAQDPAGYLAASCSHPRWLLERWLNHYGYQETLALCQADNEPPPLTLRANRLRASRDGLAQALAAEGITTRSCSLAPDCLVVTGGAERLRQGQAWRQGWFTIQGEGSLLVGYLASPLPGWRVDDLCAGVGGKATHLAELMDGRGRVVAYDKSAARLRLLEQEAQRLGVEIETRVADATQLPGRGESNLVLVDAPCSGTGTLRRRPDARWRKTPRQLETLPGLQLALLGAGAGLLHKGGYLIYTTCSLEPEENEQVVAAFLANHPGYQAQDCRDALPFLPPDAFGEGGRFVRLLPHRHGTDGMYMAALTSPAAGGKSRR